MELEQEDEINVFLNRTRHSHFFPFNRKYLFCNGRTQPQTPYQGQVPSPADETRSCTKQCDQNIGTKHAIFTASLHARMTGYSDVVPELKKNRQLKKVGPAPSL